MRFTLFTTGRLGIRARLFAAFGGMLGAMLLAAGLAAYGVWQTIESNRSRAEQAQRLGMVGQWSQHARANLERIVNATRLEATGADDDTVKSRVAPLLERMAVDISETAAASNHLKDRVTAAVAADAELSQATAEVEKRRQAFIALRGKIRDDLQMGEGSKRIEAELLPAGQAMLDAQVRLTQLLSQRGEASNQKLQQHAQQAMQWLAGGLVAALVIGGILALSTARAVSRPLQEATAMARRVADGDLTAPVQTDRTDEIGQLMSALADMQSALRRLVGGIRTTAGGVQSASSAVAGGSLDLNQRSDRAAGSLQHTSAAIEQLQRVVAETVDAAHSAAASAHEAVDVARSGSDLVARVVHTMQDMASNSRKVEEIVGIIDGIAFRTNILALNAAVEAARSGEHGRGFAVVASEVRTLAQRSATAAREIKALIATSSANMEAGSHLAVDAGNTMMDIVARITDVDRSISDIDGAAQSQAAGIDAVTASVAELERVIQINASLVEQTANSADGLNRQAGELADAVSRFRCDEQECGDELPA